MTMRPQTNGIGLARFPWRRMAGSMPFGMTRADAGDNLQSQLFYSYSTTQVLRGRRTSP